MWYKFRNFELKISINLKKENLFIYSNLAYADAFINVFSYADAACIFKTAKDRNGELIFIPLYCTTNIGK